MISRAEAVSELIPEYPQSSLERKNSRSSEEANTQASLKRKKPCSSEEAKSWAATICSNSQPAFSKLTQHIPKLKYKESNDGNEIQTTTYNHGT